MKSNLVTIKQTPPEISPGQCACGCGSPVAGLDSKRQPRRRLPRHSFHPRTLQWRENPETGCWDWAKQILHHGYGSSSFWGRPEVAHRAVWRYFNGPVDAATDLHHKCGNRACVNPAHLEPVDHAEHAAEGGHLGRRRRDRVRALAQATPLSEVEQLAARFDVAVETIACAIVGSRSFAALGRRRRRRGPRACAQSKGRFGELVEVRLSDGVPYGFCHCGCGQKTRIQTVNDRNEGRVKGEPYRFVLGHSPRIRSVLRWREDLDTGCWIWQGARGIGGYGNSRFWGPGQAAHRAVWRYFRGEQQHELHHVCGNRLCVNPDHLVDLPRREHVYEDRALLRPEEQREVRERAKTMPLAYLRELAEEYGVSIPALLNAVLSPDAATYRRRSIERRASTKTKEIV